MKNKISILSILLLVTLLPFVSYSQKTRDDIDESYKWNLNDIYASDEEWNAAKDKIVQELPKLADYKGKLTQSADDLLACLELKSAIDKEASKLFIYASMNYDLDTRVAKYAGMKQELQQIFSEASAQFSFITPEILSVDYTVYEEFITAKPALKVYEKELKDLFRSQEHTLNEGEERIMAFSTLATGVSSSVYRTFTNAEMPYPEVTLSTGETVTLNSQGYGKYRASANRDDRELVFEAFWNNYKNFEGTLGQMLNGHVMSELFSTKSRNYQSTLESALFPNNIPVEVYTALIENVNKNLPTFHRYLTLKKRMMGLDTLKYLDLYAPVVKGVELEYKYNEAKEMILNAFKPMGEEYVSTVNKAFNERWIDVYPTAGKRSGAYSNGAFYDGHPYILLNYNGMYNDVSTLAHELGHTMHSYYSNKTQPYPLSDYSIFVAEVASTFDEVLLFDYTLKNIKDDDIKLSLLMNRLDGFKGTLFRQTQFAEFEYEIHKTAQEGNPLTGETLSAMYRDIVRKYYGHDENICYVDDYINMEWAFIPHFYYSFYVYQYSTSYVASNALAEKVLNNEEGALEKYINFISSGGSDYPINQLKDAGVDMTSPDAFVETIKAMNQVMDEIEKILDKKGM